MIVHALQILRKELDMALRATVQGGGSEVVALDNIAQQDKSQGENSSSDFNKVVITLINIREEKTMKNGPYSRRNDATLRTEYFNPAVFLNLYLLISANQTIYNNALVYLSRVAAFFQSKNVFTHLNSSAVSDTDVAGAEQMESFKMIIDLYSPSFEELNHIWGTLGGKQVPCLVYVLRMLEVTPSRVEPAGAVVGEVLVNVHDKNQSN
jgi:Pvc16 N-terminal domain